MSFVESGGEGVELPFRHLTLATRASSKVSFTRVGPLGLGDVPRGSPPGLVSSIATKGDRELRRLLSIQPGITTAVPDPFVPEGGSVLTGTSPPWWADVSANLTSVG